MEWIQLCGSLNILRHFLSLGLEWKVTFSSSGVILKEISPEYSLEGLMLRLKLQYFVHLMWRTDSFEKTLMLARLKVGGEGDNRGWDGWMASPIQWTWVWVNSRSWWWTGRPGMLQFTGSQRVGHDSATERQEYMSVTTSEVWLWLLFANTVS